MRRAAAIGAAAAVLLGGCASAPPTGTDVPAAASVVHATLRLAGRDVAADWFVADAPTPPAALVTLQHGFTRRCGNVRDTGLALAGAGLLGLCLDAGMAGGNPALADALAAALVAGSVLAPGGQPLPRAIVAGGHSAGGHFASRLAWSLAAAAPERLAGVLLFDPVAADASFSANLLAASAAGQRPVLALSADAGRCNAQHNAYPALRAVQAAARAAGADGFVGLQLTDGSSHADVEGGNSDLAAIVLCGAPRAHNTEIVRTLAARWAADMAAGMRTPAAYPGGAWLDGVAVRVID